MGYTFRHESPIEIKGYPLWSIAIGADEAKGEKSGKAKGIIAIGDEATGAIAVGYVAKGIFALGLIAIGIVSVGLISLGVFAIGLLAAGVIVARGVAAVALFYAVGKFAVAYKAYGDFYLSVGNLVNTLSSPSGNGTPIGE